MKRSMVIIAAGILVSLGAATSFAGERESEDKVVRQLGRGVANVLTGILEVPVNMYQVQDEHGEMAGATYGLIRGIWRFGVREVVGVYEIITVPFVRLDPIVEPEWICESSPVDIFYRKRDRFPSALEPKEWEVNSPRLNLDDETRRSFSTQR